MPTDLRPTVFVTVGTDHHPFARLMHWIETWPRRADARVVVQHGTTPPPAGVEAAALLDAEAMAGLFSTAVAVVCAGGPATVMDARRHGRRPIVVARRGDLGEHVDDHQLAFSRFLAATDVVTAPVDARELHRELDAALDDPDRYRIEIDDTLAPGIANVGAMIDDLVWSGR